MRLATALSEEAHTQRSASSSDTWCRRYEWLRSSSGKIAWERRNVGIVAESSASDGDVMPPKAMSAALSRSATKWTSAVGSESTSGHEVSQRVRRKLARSASGNDSVVWNVVSLAASSSAGADGAEAGGGASSSSVCWLRVRRREAWSEREIAGAGAGGAMESARSSQDKWREERHPSVAAVVRAMEKAARRQ
eukprot:545900-Pleurochrysis_carterae.AAC.3